jgi:ribosomal protein L11 methyltransferase
MKIADLFHLTTMKNYIHIRFQPVTKEQQEILIAQLAELGYEGFEEGVNYISAYIPEDQFDEQATYDFTANSDMAVTKEVIAPRNWNQEWEQNFQPVQVNSFCAIRAHFHEPVPGVAHEVIITPKMSFGTGHHATTYLMIQGMQPIAFAGKKVLDFGTGTGVLAILAGQLGARDIYAIDNDDWSINNAAENIELNNSSYITLEKRDHLQLGVQFDVVLANINKHVLLANMDGIQQHLSRDGVVLMSGLLVGDRPDIEKAAEESGLEVLEQQVKDNWLCLKLKKKSAQ